MRSCSAPAGPAPRAETVLVEATLDLATTWLGWCVLTLRGRRLDDGSEEPGRIVAGRLGEISLFATLMIRVDEPHGPASTTWIFNSDSMFDLVVCGEVDARVAAAAIDARRQVPAFFPALGRHRA